jgi:hypothetical protein
MKRILGVIGSILGLGLSLAGSLPAANDRVPVLLELFTSEGCSSCPPADTLLEKLDAQQPVAGADLIVLSEHVDYWNQLGWRDPFSSAVFSTRQNDYASHIDTSEVYTPELIVDGTWGVVGSRHADVEKAIGKAIQRGKQTVHVEAKQNGDRISVQVQIDPASGVHGQRAVYAVLARNHVASHVQHGENAGRDLQHVAVAYAITKIGTVGTDGSFRKNVDLRLPPQSGQDGSRVVVFIQEDATSRVAGVAQARL